MKKSLILAGLAIVVIALLSCKETQKPTKTPEKAPEKKAVTKAEPKLKPKPKLPKPEQKLKLPKFRNIGSQGGFHFVYTESKTEEELMQIAEFYRKVNKGKPAFGIHFFNDDKKAARKLPMDNAAMSSWFASYNFDKEAGIDKLEEVNCVKSSGKEELDCSKKAFK